MRITTTLFVLMFTIAAPVAAENNLISEPHALVYYQIPFSGDAPDTRSNFGLRMDRAQYEAGQAVDYREVMLRPAVMDLRFNDSGVESLKFGGVDYLAQYRTLKAEEEQGAEGAAAPEPAGDTAKAEEKATTAEPARSGDTATEEKAKTEEDKLTMDKLMHNIPVGYFIGAGIGIILAVGAGS